MNICVFCSANEQLAPDSYAMAGELGAWAAKNGHSIVFGGHDAGLMHAVSKAAREAGGHVIGVVPRRIVEMGRLSPWMDVEIPTDDLTDRKQEMMARSEAFVVMPGGVGTLDELFTVAAMHTLDYHRKPIILWNIGGFWNSLAACLDDLQGKGAMRGAWTDHIRVATTLADVQLLLAD